MEKPQPLKFIGPDFNIDNYLNRYVPRPCLYLLPTPISWFLGHREHPEQKRQIGSILKWFWGAVGAFLGILVVEAVFMTPALKSEGTPVVIGSLGAAAILHFSVLASPLSQPRNAVISQLLASILGVSVTKLFALLPREKFNSLRFLAGALSVALTSLAMGVTNCVHPPAGATALLAATSPEIGDMGWWLIPVVVLGSVLLVVVSCVVGNAQQRWPLYWWTPVKLPAKRNSEIERRGSESTFVAPSAGRENLSKSGCESDLETGNGGRETEREEVVLITGGRIMVPACLQLGIEQRAVLEILQAQLRDEMCSGIQRSNTMDTDITKVHDAL